MEFVVAAVYGHIPDDAMRNPFMNRFVNRHVQIFDKFPYRVKALKYTKVICNVILEEVVNIISDCSNELESRPFVSLASDFYKDRYRREDYGALTASVIAEKYRLRD